MSCHWPACFAGNVDRPPKRQRQTGFTHRLIMYPYPVAAQLSVLSEPEVEALPANSL